MRAWTSWPQRWPRLNHVRDWHDLVWQTDLLRAEKRGVSVPNLRVLVVAPTSDLPDTAAEIAAIHRCHETTILAGSVRDVDIAQAVIEQSYDVLWLIGHGDEQGVECAVTRYGDIREVDWHAVEPVDLLCGGFPCMYGHFTLRGFARCVVDLTRCTAS